MTVLNELAGRVQEVDTGWLSSAQSLMKGIGSHQVEEYCSSRGQEILSKQGDRCWSIEAYVEEENLGISC